jgi:hypothetical protein
MFGYPYLALSIFSEKVIPFNKFISRNLQIYVIFADDLILNE